MNARVFRDAYGVPHLRAGDPLALVYLQGTNAAADRAWQLELERRRFLGTSAAFLGPEAAGWDVFARQARLADTAQRCFEALDEQTREWITAYVEGVNHALPGGAARAPEFAETGLTLQEWEPWAPLGIWLAVHILFAGFPSKLWRTHVARTLGDDKIDLFTSEGPRTAGSNGWMIPGSLSSSGQAIVAGDPHRYIESPGVYQQLRLSCPEYDVLGLAVPGIPGVAHFGHTGEVAWAITNAMADYQDLYAEQLRPAGPGLEALGPDGWKPAQVHTEVVEVAGADPIEVEVIETERGPVIVNDSAQTISLRYPPRVTGRLGFEVIPRLLQATTVADIDAAVGDWVEPVNVILAADTAGGLLHRTAGLVPRRHADNMLRVVPAWEAEHQWDGWHDPMPRATVDGPAVMANARELAAPLGVEFAALHRSHRIRELVTSQSNWSVAEMPSIHKDTYLGSAGCLLALLVGMEDLSPEAVALRTELLGWDRRMDATSSTASSYAAIRKALVSRLADHFGVLEDAQVPEVFVPWMDVLTHVSYAVENLLTTELIPDVNVSWLAREALEEVAARKRRPPWGETHQLSPLHALRGPVFAPGEEPFDLGLSGDHHCVRCTSSLPGLTDVCVRGSAARYAWDLADRSASRWVVPLGASGVLGEPHHHDQLPLWLRGELAPIVTDWDALEREDRSFTHEIEGFGTVRIVEADPSRDLDLIHGWVTAERASFWGMGGLSRDAIAATYEFLDSVPTHHVYVVQLDGVPIGLLQTYDPQADPVGAAYEIQAGDIGAHLLVAPGDPRPGFTGNLLRALGRFVFVHLGHPRLVAEPDTRNERAVDRLYRSGFTIGPEVKITLPDGTTKTAQLGFLTAERFLN
ncbi:GNAT family N-acetyltransferase [Kribbella capetownensis]|uniref:Lysine N-acyltransferase MbtK n=1 Tax=Kribbella capetownensis TaxID=1572659 RepID=A0A4R0K121_9ACTN|nr:GNAT family N-acetyltransferase [Kribbella capetownensis]TCC52294.1 GNAT family N-acetyltransferase [Kribbella capetownensis]